MYGFNLSNRADVNRAIESKEICGPIRIGVEYIVSVPIDDGKNSVFFGEMVTALDIADAGFSFQFQVHGNPNRIVIIPASIALVTLLKSQA